MGWGWLKTLGKGAAAVAPVVLPAILPGSVAVQLTQLVGAVEQLKGPGNGAAKKDAVILAFTSSLAMAEGLSASDLLNDAAFVAAVSNAIDAIVAAENVVDNLKRLRTPEAA